MGGIAKLFMPKAPALAVIPEPKKLPDPPSYEDDQRAKEVAEKRAAIRRNRKGRSSTILTTADGLEDNELTTKKKMLGA